MGIDCVRIHTHAAKICTQLYAKPKDVMVSRKYGKTFVALEGSDTISNWFDNMCLFKKNNVHFGFNRYCDWCIDTYDIQDTLDTHSNIVLCGHSLGAAAVLLMLTKMDLSNVDEVVLFGCPKIGNSNFKTTTFMEKVPLDLPITSYVNGTDVVPSLPPTWMGFVDLVEESHRIESANSTGSMFSQIEDHGIDCYVQSISKHYQIGKDA